MGDQDARSSARRIVAEVLAAHGLDEPARETPVTAAGPDEPAVTVSDDVAPPLPGSPTDARTTVPQRDPEAGAAARRIVEEVLADHERAERERDAAGPPPLPAAALPTGPPPVPARVEEPGPDPASAVEPGPVPAPVEEPAPDRPPTVDDDPPEAVARRLVDEVLLARGRTPDPADPGTSGPARPADGHPLQEPDLFAPTSRPAAEDLDPSVLEAVVPSESWATPWDDTPPSVVLRPEPPEPVRAGRWLLATVVAAVAIAYLLPLAIAALRDLVSLGG